MASYLAVILLTAQVSGQTVQAPGSAAYSSRLWSNEPAANYNNSYLIGNGRIGGAVYGNVASELVSVNEDSFWSGGVGWKQHGIVRTEVDTRSVVH